MYVTNKCKKIYFLSNMFNKLAPKTVTLVSGLFIIKHAYTRFFILNCTEKSSEKTEYFSNNQ